MQDPIPANVIGVTVDLTVNDPNGNCINIGTASTDTSHMLPSKP
jgi:hypothetical protein